MKYSPIIGLAVILLVGGYGTNADAGYQDESDGVVTIDRFVPTSPNVAGALGTTRNSPDQTSYLDCTLFASTSGTSMACYALTSTDYLFCSSNDAANVAAVRGISSASFVAFTADNHGNCTNVVTLNSSRYSPKH